MFAKHLESFLMEELSKTDLTARAIDDIHNRFEALRGCALIPRGRGKNSTHLTLTEISAAVLSIAAAKPGWAGFGALGLANLQPVGGTGASFDECPTFGAVIETVLRNGTVRKKVTEIRLSNSEIYMNSYSRASVRYKSGGTSKISYYVSRYAVSLIKPGAERSYDPTSLISTAITETVLFQSFFDHLSSEIEQNLPPPQPDPEEEDEEVRKEQRARRLGLTKASRFLNMGVDNQVTWPREEMVVEFNGHKLILLPKTEEYSTSIHVDLHGQKLPDDDAVTLFNRFLSLLAWCNDNYAILQSGWSGNPVPVPVPKRNLAFTTAYNWTFFRNSPKSPEARKAIAIYRDGRNAEQNFLVGYAVLCYYKIIELKHKGRTNARTWFRDHYPLLRDNAGLAKDVAEFEKACGTQQPETYLYEACRSAVAHANKPYSSDPDDVHELRRLHVAAAILRPLARIFIESELGVSTCPYDGT
ncbi:MAG TPA: methylamine utilization protein MauJ [Rhizomicrobium sp.]|nr:methylamine utilization protein MauJ [Rhizomicrobium sp.]